MLLCGEKNLAYNISNPDSIVRIKDMAEMLAHAAGIQIQYDVASEEEKKGFNPMSNSSLNSDSLQALGWRGIFSAERGFTHTVEILKSIAD